MAAAPVVRVRPVARHPDGDVVVGRDDDVVLREQPLPPTRDDRRIEPVDDLVGDDAAVGAPPAPDEDFPEPGGVAGDGRPQRLSR